MFEKLFNTKRKYAVGQVWNYHTRPGEETSAFTIVNIEEHDTLGTILSIYVEGLKILSPDNDDCITEVTHMPFSKDAIDQSIAGLKSKAEKLPGYSEGYQSWKEQFDKGEAGIFTITVMQAIDYMEQAINQ